MKVLFQIIIISIVCLSFLSTGIFAQDSRGVRIERTNADGSKKEVQLYDGSYALIIGNSDYTNGWNRLSGVKSDVIAVREVLLRHGFKVEIEENLTSERFESRIKRFINDYGFDRNNRLIIYYAGHGYTLNSAGDNRNLGYVIPSDAPLPTKDERGFRQKAVDMYAMQNFAKQIQAKHALFIFDSCFSGKLFALRDTLKISPFIYDKVEKPVRQFITAGDETQTVPDESVFRKAFIRGLEGDADRNGDSYITGTELAEYLKESVTNYSNRRQTPQYGLINDIDLDRGDFVFVKPSNNVANSESFSAKITTPTQPYNSSITSKQSNETIQTKNYPPCSISYLSYSPVVNISANGNFARIQMVVDNKDIDAAEIKAVSNNPNDVSVTFDNSGRRFDINKGSFIVKSISGKVGNYSLSFSLPCGQKQVNVSVR